MSLFNTGNKVTTKDQLYNLIVNEAKRLQDESEKYTMADEPVVKYFSGINVIMTPQELEQFIMNDLVSVFEDNFPNVSFNLDYEEKRGGKVNVKGFYLWLDVLENPEVLYKLAERVVKSGVYPYWYKYLTGEKEPTVLVWLSRDEFDRLIKRLEELLKENPKYIISLSGEKVGDDVVVNSFKVRKARKMEKPQVYVEVL